MAMAVPSCWKSYNIKAVPWEKTRVVEKNPHATGKLM